MAKLIIEMAASDDVGLTRAIGTYRLERYDPLILSSCIIFKPLDTKVGTVGDEIFSKRDKSGDASETAVDGSTGTVFVC